MTKLRAAFRIPALLTQPWKLHKTVCLGANIFTFHASPQGGCLLGVRGMASSSNQATDSCSLLEAGGSSSSSSFEHIEADEVPTDKTLSVSDLRSIDFSKECPDQLNMSFAGCGFLGIYHLGVAKALQIHGRGLLDRLDMFGGASAGALVATLLALKTHNPNIVQECVDLCLETAEMVHKRRGGLFNPSLCLMSKLTDFLREQVPDDAHLVASGRVFLSVTDKASNENVIVCEYESKEDLISCMLASSYVPYITGKKPVKWKGKKYIDGGMTNNLPILAQGRTILVTPFTGSRKDICPPCSQTGRNWNVTINKENYIVSRGNIVRGLHAFFPPKVKHLKTYFLMGQRDAVRFLKREGIFEQSPGVNNQTDHTDCDQSSSGSEAP